MKERQGVTDRINKRKTIRHGVWGVQNTMTRKQSSWKAQCTETTIRLAAELSVATVEVTVLLRTLKALEGNFCQLRKTVFQK